MQLAIFENYKVKLTAFVVAILFWFAVVTESNYQYDMDVRIQPVNVPGDRIIVNDLASWARVRFEGNGKSLLALRFTEEATLEMNLENVKADANIPLNNGMLRIPRRSRRIDSWHVLSPDTVVVKLAYLERKTVPIASQIQMETAPAFTLVGKIQLFPDSVLISGPIQQVRLIERIFTEELAFSERLRDISGKAKLKAPADSLKISMAEHEVAFEADIQKLVEHSFKEVPVQVINIPRNQKITPRPSTVDLIVIGGEEHVLQFEQKDFSVIVDYNYNQKNDQNTLGYMPITRHPPDMRVAKIIPDYIKLEIER